MLARRRAIAGLCCALATALAVADAPPWNRAEQQRLLAEAETALQAGDTDAARRRLERAALTGHAADVELAQLRTLMQAGEYRQALAFAAHVAGAHLDAPAGAVMYAWLLRLGGQQAVASQVLDAASQRLPGDPLLAQVSDWWAAADPMAATSVPPWLAPYAVGSPPTPQARMAGGALLLPDGRHAVAALAADVADIAPRGGEKRIWLRNGLGRTITALPVRRDAVTGLVLLRAAEPFDTPPGWARAPREPFAGSSAYAVGFAPSASARAAWPQLSLGFLGATVAGSETRWLGIDVPRGTAGAPVMDASGRIVGIALAPGAEGRARMAGIVALEDLAGPLPPPADGPASRLSLDEAYERAMRVSLQVLVAPR